MQQMLKYYCIEGMLGEGKVWWIWQILWFRSPTSRFYLRTYNYSPYGWIYPFTIRTFLPTTFVSAICQTLAPLNIPAMWYWLRYLKCINYWAYQITYNTRTYNNYMCVNHVEYSSGVLPHIPGLTRLNYWKFQPRWQSSQTITRTEPVWWCITHQYNYVYAFTNLTNIKQHCKYVHTTRIWIF